MAVVTLPPNQTASDPQVTTPGAADAESAAANATSATKVTRQRTTAPRADRAPLAPASAWAPNGQRQCWHFSFRCKTCGAYCFGRARTLDEVTGERRARCGHIVTVMVARTYTSPEAP